MMEKSFGTFGLKELVDEAVSVDCVKQPKPNPEGTHKVLRRFGLEPSKAIFIGDTVTDIKAAKNAGMQSIGVLSGIGTEKELRNTGADFVIRSVSHLHSILKV